jgi:hypothetical protein
MKHLVGRLRPVGCVLLEGAHDQGGERRRNRGTSQLETLGLLNSVSRHRRLGASPTEHLGSGQHLVSHRAH